VNGLTIMDSYDGGARGLQDGERKDRAVQSIRRQLDCFDELTQERSDIRKISKVEIVLKRPDKRVEPR